MYFADTVAGMADTVGLADIVVDTADTVGFAGTAADIADTVDFAGTAVGTVDIVGFAVLTEDIVDLQVDIANSDFCFLRISVLFQSLSARRFPLILTDLFYLLVSFLLCIYDAPERFLPPDFLFHLYVTAHIPFRCTVHKVVCPMHFQTLCFHYHS